jgi:hypothetical protein
MPMVDDTRYAKTQKGVAEIRDRGKDLRGRMRTMLILVDPSRSVDDLRAQAAQLGVDANFLEMLIDEGYIAVAAAGQGASTAGPGAPSAAELRATAGDELERFRAAKSFINETVVDALGVRAFMFTLKLERCATRAELAQLLPDYAKAIGKARSETETRLLVGRARELLS